MAAIGIEAGIRGQGATGVFASIVRAAAVSAVLLGGAGLAQASELDQHIAPPSAAEVAMLRSLLALQHPTLRQGVAPAVAQPSAGAVPAQPAGSSDRGSLDGEVCVPGSSRAACDAGVEDSTRSARLSGDFRASLQRAVAVAGLHRERL